jgi:hypothetical protein
LRSGVTRSTEVLISTAGFTVSVTTGVAINWSSV